MALPTDTSDGAPVVRDSKDFDPRSGNWLERLIFNNRLAVVLACTVATLLLGWQARKLEFNASFEKMVPQSHPYIRNYLENQGELRGLGNAIRVVVENTRGDVFDPAYLEVLKQVNDELALTEGVDRAWVRSIWTPVVRWKEVTEQGVQSGPVMPDSYDGSAQSIEQLRQNIGRAGIVGRLVANDFRSSLILVPLLEQDPASGRSLDYRELSHRIEANVRSKEGDGIRVRVIGFAKLMGDLIDGLARVMTYFAVAATIAALVILVHTRCPRSTALVIACSLVAVLWQLGLVALLGLALDPYSILVPFLVFAIGVSHGLQKMNGIMQDVGRGTHRLVAARLTFRRLFLAGLTALLADAVGFAVLMIIDIPVIRWLALAASVGVAVLIFTNLVLLPVALSYVGVSPGAARRSLREEPQDGDTLGAGRAWRLLDRFTERNFAAGAVTAAALLGAAGLVVGAHVQIGDLDPGAPELRPGSRYNLDNQYITTHYALSSDQFAVIVKTPPEGALRYETLVEADRLAWALRQVPGVQTATSLADTVRQVTAGTFEGSPKWLTLLPNQQVLNYAGYQAVTLAPDMLNLEGSVIPVIAYLADHKAETLDRVVQVAKEFAERHGETDRQFLLAAGSAGVEAATNIVVRSANRVMMLYVYGAVVLLCFVTFRSWRAVVVAVVPLLVTSILCEALMVILGIGVKVATLPVIALGVGIGVDYALYLLSVQLAQQRAGLPLREAYRRAVQFTGKVVGLVGVTLAAGVVTWAFSPLKFQADMGILLTFMFLWNMVGALVLIPALSHFLLKGATAAPCTVAVEAARSHAV
jgi:predicted RND superfamily exporter protein